MDGTRLKAWTSVKSVRARDEEGKPAYGGRWAQPVGGLPGERRSNATHVSTTDPEALLARKGHGQAAKLSFAGRAPDWDRLVMSADEGLGPWYISELRCTNRGYRPGK